jgi:hypothetical protein
MSQQAIESGMDRRTFLKAAAVSAVAASATGAGAAIIAEQKEAAIPIVSPPPIAEPIETAAEFSQDASELLARLASIKADNVRLQAQLQVTQEQLKAARSSQADPGRAATETLQGQLNEANTKIGTLTDQVGLLGGLVALYEQLEEVDLGAVVDEGLATVGTAVDELAEMVPSVSEGLEAGQQALSEFEEQLPVLEEGRRWLANQLMLVTALYQALELALQNGLEATSAFLRLLSDWFQDILRWLPFGIGRRASEIMAAMTNLLAELPNTTEGLHINVAQPLDQWLAKEGDETNLQRQLIKPVRERAIGQASAAMDKAGTIQTTYRNRLSTPVQEAKQQRQAILDQIEQYRGTHQI